MPEFRPCTGPSEAPGKPCGRAVYATDLCPGHYRQRLAGEPLRPLRTARGTAGRTQGIRAEQSLITGMRIAADEDGIDEPEAWRRAAQAWLASRIKRK